MCVRVCVRVYRMCAGGFSAVLLHMVVIGGLLGVLRCVVAVCCCSVLQWKDLLIVDYKTSLRTVMIGEILERSLCVRVRVFVCACVRA